MAATGISNAGAGVSHTGTGRVFGTDLVATAHLIAATTVHAHTIAQWIAGADIWRIRRGNRLQVHFQIWLF